MSNDNANTDLPPAKKYQLKKTAAKNPLTAAVLGFLISPLGYYYAGKTGWALINLLTLNYCLAGIVIVPIHVWFQIQNARDELDADNWDV